MAGFITTFTAIATMVAAYVYLNWGIMQILGVAFILITVNAAVENKPAWQKNLLVIVVFSLMVLGHFVINDNIMNWGALLLSAVLLLICILLISGIYKLKPGDGSVLTAYVLGLIIFFPIAIYTLYQGMQGLGYW